MAPIRATETGQSLVTIRDMAGTKSSNSGAAARVRSILDTRMRTISSLAVTAADALAAKDAHLAAGQIDQDRATEALLSLLDYASRSEVAAMVGIDESAIPARRRRRSSAVSSNPSTVETNGRDPVNPAEPSDSGDAGS
jgi:hypothetical protein